MNILSQITVSAKPFLKWAGGKTQLISAIEAALPLDLVKKEKFTYIEPFIGSGAIMFWFLQRFPNVDKAIINDINPDLTKAYVTIKESPFILIDALQKKQDTYYGLKTEKDRKSFFLEMRHEFNSRDLSPLDNTVLLIFLNKTCFNGLYRVNSKNQFNVPFGRYNNPKICDAETIAASSMLLQKVTILNGDYQDTVKLATGDTLFYLDPPYRPLSKTASFNAYVKNTFDDAEQRRLRQFCEALSAKKYWWLLSNSDPKNINPEDNFFDDLYSGADMSIQRVKATRRINSDSTKRGEIYELLISNYGKGCTL